MKATVYVQGGVYTFEDVAKVEQGAGAVSVTQSVKQESTSASGLVLYSTKQAEKRTLIPWHRIEQVKVED